jgi:hypothetical protein
MLNREAANTARNQLKKAAEEHASQLATATKVSTELYDLRSKTSHEVVGQVEEFVNSLANTPREFDRTFAEYHVERRAFDGVVAEIDGKIRDTTVKSSTGVGAGVAAGAATALAGPSVAMAVATTFGTASTGTAISALSGAAATNAALAWLGGGALAAGGGGMSAGGALLALAGPIGWGLAGVAAAGGVAYMAYSNSQTVKEADEKRLQVEGEIRSLKAVVLAVIKMKGLTQAEVDGMRTILRQLRQRGITDYRSMDGEDKSLLKALINHVRILSNLLNKTVDIAP